MKERRVLALLALLTACVMAQVLLAPLLGVLLSLAPLLLFLVVLLLLNFTREATSPDQPWVDRPGEGS